MFVRDREGTRSLFDQVTPGCEWVLAGEGLPTRKYDGTACKIDAQGFWKRREAKIWGDAPPGFVEEDRDEVTGKRFGWVKVSETDPGDKFHREALERDGKDVPYGTYELLGPKIQGGAEPFEVHLLVHHGQTILADVTDRTLDGLRAYLEVNEIEGIVFHHPDGRMAKIKRRDFGFPWPVKKVTVQGAKA